MRARLTTRRCSGGKEEEDRSLAAHCIKSSQRAMRPSGHQTEHHRRRRLRRDLSLYVLQWLNGL